MQYFYQKKKKTDVNGEFNAMSLEHVLGTYL